MTVVHMIGNAHLDPVWLWGWQEGADEVVSTFRSAADRCDEYPEFIFTAGEAWRYSVVERLDPELFGRIEKLVAKERWDPVGGQWVQPDCNLPTGEALRKQLERGQGYFADRFGRASSVGFNPDSFGHPGTLPDLLVEAGLGAYAFHRPSFEQLELPGQLVRWRGPAGGEVLAFRIRPSYVTRASDLAGQVEISLEDAEVDHTLCLYGVGNHGGGPTKAQIEWIIEHRASFEGAELRFSTMDAFFAAVEPRRAALPLFEGELQHVFPGCYSAMHNVKRRQRRTEHLLDQAGRVVTALTPGDADARLAAAWDDILFTAFHDVLAGTSVPSAWASMEAQQGRARMLGEEVVYDATRRAARSLAPHPHLQVVAYNADESGWQGVLEVEPWLDFDEWGARWVSAPDGTPLPYQLVDAESDVLMTRLLVPAEIAARSWSTVLVRSDPEPAAAESTESALAATEARLSSESVQIGLGPGGLTRIAKDGFELLGDGGLRLHLREDESDTWTMTSDRFAGPIVSTLDDLVWSVEEEGPLRTRARGAGRLGGSPLELVASLDASGAIGIDVYITVVERHKAVQLAVELPEAPSARLDGEAGGATARELGPTEWPVQGWSRLTVGGRDVALVTGDAYSLSVDANLWQWTLVRTPRMAFPFPSERRAATRHTDQGEHEFAFELHTAATLSAATLEARARKQLQPPIVFSRYDDVERPQWGDVPPRKLWTEAERRNARRS